MRKISLSLAIMLVCGFTAFGQAVKDKAIIPVAVNLNQVLRLNVVSGGNIEFLFATIEDYKNGVNALGALGSAYETNFTVASSSRWALTYGAETANFIGTDDGANTLLIDNVGLSLISNTARPIDIVSTGGSAGSPYKSASLYNANVSELLPYPATMLTDNGLVVSSAGDDTDNDFTITWRAGTKEGTAPFLMNAVALIDQSPSPNADRYVANVIFELSSL